MPGVETIEALIAAVQAFDAAPLGLQVAPRTPMPPSGSLLRRTGLVLLGGGTV